MIANYGYKDGSGDFFIIVDTDKCASCLDKPCVENCPAQVLEVVVDDYDDEVITVREEHRKKIKYSCAPCKPTSGIRQMPCMEACALGGLNHSW
ncbi:ferredoxin [Clostridiales bacterium PH28_bin88]|nr:ferredoxin [Clostridiales bacterium PH28_bin88]